MTAKQRPWWNFRLWQLFAVITLLCVYLASQVGAVRTRKELLKELSVVCPFSQVTTADAYSQYTTLPGSQRKPPASVSYVRRWLGDEAIQSIGYDEHVVPAPLVAKLKRQFPEADVRAQEIRYPLCHPGCFPHGTLVETPLGPRRIETVSVGDKVFKVTEAGEKIPARVLSIFRTDNRLWELETSRGRLLTTETQPLCKSLRESVPAGELKLGDEILVWEDEQVQPVSIVRIEQTDQIAPVVNLILGKREPFIAGGYLARSKPPEQAMDWMSTLP